MKQIALNQKFSLRLDLMHFIILQIEPLFQRFNILQGLHIATNGLSYARSLTSIYKQNTPRPQNKSF